GERFIPGEGGAEIEYEHLHRYQFALRWARGKRVLDLAAGSGYGAALLSRVAEAVWAVELDEQAVSHARSCYSAPSLLFLRSDVRELPIRSASLDVVVALEVLEHVLEQERLIGEIARVLRPGGVALISTPNRATYSEARNYSNPYHVREL